MSDFHDFSLPFFVHHFLGIPKKYSYKGSVIIFLIESMIELGPFVAICVHLGLFGVIWVHLASFLLIFCHLLSFWVIPDNVGVI